MSFGGWRGGDPDRAAKAQAFVDSLGSPSATAAHARHIPLSKCEDIGLKIERLEDDKKLQDLVLTVHHAYMHTFSMTSAIKITENHMGVATVLMGVMQQVARPAPPPAQNESQPAPPAAAPPEGEAPP